VFKTQLLEMRVSVGNLVIALVRTHYSAIPA
jgi:hypothetical protein